MKRLCLILWVLLLDFAPTQAAAEKAVLEIAPSLSELGEGWTTNVVAYLLDPSSRPPEIDFQNDVTSSPLLEAQRQAMKGNERTGCGLLLYGRGDLIMNSGLYRVFVQRWSNTRALHNAWVDWKMNPDRVVRTHPPVGEDFFWVCEWWRQTPIRQNFVFRRGLFHVTIEAGADSDTAAVVQLAQVIDGKIKARPLPDPSGTAPSGAGGSTASPSSTAVELWSTSLDLRQRLSPGEGVRFSTEPSPARDVIVVEPDKRFQVMLGLGASLEPTTCSNLWSMAAADRDEVIEQLVGPLSGIGMNLMRICIGSPDFTGDPWYSYDDLLPGQTDPGLDRFSIEKDRAYILPVLKRAKSKNLDLLFFASPWSPPGWMKSTGSLIGGHLLPEYYAVYAQYLVRFIRAYQSEGIPVYAITVQNEPGVDRAKEKDPKWFYPSCRWTAEEEREFIRDHLGPAFRREGLQTKIWCYDHNYNVQPSGDDPGLSYPRTILSDARAGEFIDGVAFHGYDGDASGMTQFHDEFPVKPVYFTEGSVFGSHGAVDLIERLRNWASSYTAWVSMLDDHGQPNRGPFPATYAIVKLDSKTRKPEYLFEYYAYGQFMKFIQRGAVRIASSRGSAEVDNVAFRNPDGSIVLVVANTTSESRAFEVRSGTNRCTHRLEGRTIVTMRWMDR